MKNTVLKTNNISIVFGGLHAVDNFSIEIKEGELVGLIGPNGAGKTTVFNMLTGVYTPTSGTVELNGQDVTKMSPHNRVKIGIARTFQNIRLFKRMSVLENVKVSSNIHMNYGILAGIFKTRKYWEQEDKATKEALEILEVALKKPFMQICENAGYDYQEVLININEDKWFDAANNTYVNMKESGIIDPASVEKSAIMSAISISGIFLTTECAIVSNDSKNPVNEENLL